MQILASMLDTPQNLAGLLWNSQQTLTLSLLHTSWRITWNWLNYSIVGACGGMSPHVGIFRNAQSCATNGAARVCGAVLLLNECGLSLRFFALNHAVL